LNTPDVTPGLAVAAAQPGVASRKRSRRGLSPWVDFAIKRTFGVVANLVVLVLVTFFIVRLIPGDPAVSVAGLDASVEQVEQVRVQLGLTGPLPQQLFDYLARLTHGDLGQSFALNDSVVHIISVRLPFTAGIALLAMLLVLVVAVPSGMAVGVLTRGGRHRWLDNAFGFGTSLVAAVPGYIMATFLVLVFAVNLAILPPAYSLAHPALSFVLPILGLAIGPICIVARVVRRETAVVLEQDYIRTARGWRLRAMKLYAKYALPGLITSTLTLSGLILTGMLGSAIVVETVFNWPGLGLSIIGAILTKDYPVIQGVILVLGVLASLLILLVDVILGLIDPRTLGGKRA
jgi:peptide/nickel transport system permease protein